MQTEQQQALTTEPDDVQQHLHDVQALLERQQVVENLARAQQDEAGAEEQAPQESLAQREHLAELRQLVERLHPADIAYILEALPLDERLLVWDQVAPERDGDILLELSDAVRESLIEHMEHHELAAVAQNLEADELADLADDLPPEVIESAIAAREE
ncbi:MAG: magnesium transporter, partial [Rhodocyclaceae bacterium]|nr:magnesium transporter [Rhodocyclaceae bacterium]